MGLEVEVRVGPIAHGGFAVARHEGRAVFVRHALPGELVRARVTEGGAEDRFWRADAVAVLEPAPDGGAHRVTPPCPAAGPGGCGGCDFQHVTPAHQRELKAEVVREQLRRLAGREVDVVVEAVPGDVDGLGWRTRQRYAVLPDGRRAMKRHRSSDLVPVEHCLLEAPPEVAQQARVVHGRAFATAPDGFWQVHPGAPEALVDAVLSALEPQPGESVLDLYAGVGLFARFVGERTGAAVTTVEGDAAAAPFARTNLADLPGPVDVVTADVLAHLRGDAGPGPVDLVVLDPPRVGAKKAVVEQIAARTPRAIAYVACDPAALARDVALFAELGYDLTGLRAFDLFPMTHHVECVAVLTPTGTGAG